MHELQEVAGPDLVRGDKKQIRPSRDVRFPLRLGPLRVGWGDLVDRRQVFLIGSRNPDLREIPACVWRRFLHVGLLRSRDADQPLALDERSQPGKLDPCGVDRRARRLVRLHLGDARGDALAARERGTGFAKRHKIALQIALGDCLELRERHVHALGGAQHLAELVGAEGERVRRGRFLLCEPCVEILHRLDRTRVRGAELGLQLRIRHRRENARDVLFVEVRQASKHDMSYLDVGPRQRRAQVRAYLPGRGGDRRRVSGVGPQALGERRVWARDVHVRLQSEAVIGGAAKRPLE